MIFLQCTPLQQQISETRKAEKFSFDPFSQTPCVHQIGNQLADRQGRGGRCAGKIRLTPAVAHRDRRWSQRQGSTVAVSGISMARRSRKGRQRARMDQRWHEIDWRWRGTGSRFRSAAGWHRRPEHRGMLATSHAPCAWETVVAPNLQEGPKFVVYSIFFITKQR
jgi:hypothetical protein